MGLQEPDVPELIRDLFQVTAGIAEDVSEIKEDQREFVTKESHELRVGALEKRVDHLEDDKSQYRRILVSALIFPILVGLVAWLLMGAKA